MDWARLDAVADELAASRAEVVGLVVLVLGGIVATWLVVQRPLPSGDPAEVVGVASSASPDAAGGPSPGAEAPTTASVRDVLVHVTGAVATPGVVTLSGDARVVEAVAAAGGATTEAATEVLPMARVVVDGETLHVPTLDEAAAWAEAGVPPSGPSAPGSGAPGPAAGAWLADGRLDLTVATVADLEELPGIGPVLAERIAAHREAIGGFEAVGQLREVSGIGEATFQDLADLVAVP